MKPPIIITGAARSGTSMVAGIVSLCGASGGAVLGPTPHNRKGQFENREIIQTIIKPYLRMQGYDPMGQRPLPDVEHLLAFDNLRYRVEEIIKRQGVGDDETWFFKGAKVCLTWPIWNKAFPDAKWIVVRRNREEIVQSCLRTGFMRRRSTKESWREWVCHHEDLFLQMSMAGIDVKEIWPAFFFVGDFLKMKETIGWLGLDWNVDTVVDFISPALWNGGEEHGLQNDSGPSAVTQ